MLKYIRWQGVVAFAVLGALVAVFWMLVVDGLVKGAIESLGTRVVGARVELAGADVSFIPLGLELTGLRVTDPDEPMTNVLEFRRAAFGVETWQLLKRRFIIDEMSVEGLQTGTPRKTSGAIEKAAGSSAKKGRKGAGGGEGASGLLGAISVPDIKDILANEDLTTISLAREFQQDVTKQEEKFKKRIGELPDEKTLKEYDKRAKEIEKLAKKGLPSAIEAASKADQLKKDIDRDLKHIKRTRRDLDKTLSNYQARIKDIKSAPTRDIARLKKKYAPTSSGAVNASRLLLGPVLSGRLERMMSYWDKYGSVAKRVKEAGGGEKRPPRGEGVDIRFPDRSALPGFLVRKALVTAVYRGSDLSGELQNITFEQDVLGKPLTYDFSGNRLGWAEALALRGTVNRTKPGSPVDTLEAHVKKYDTSGMKLSGGGSLPVDLTAGAADLDLYVRRATGTLDADADAHVNGVRLTLDKGRARLGSMTGAVEEALASITSVSAEARAKGTEDDYQVTVTSDVDDKLRAAVSRLVQKQVAEFGQKLDKEVRAAVDEHLSGLDGQLGGLRLQETALDNIQGSLDGLLSQIKLI